MTWVSGITTLLGPAGVALIGVAGYLLALGTYKLIKEWLPF